MSLQLHKAQPTITRKPDLGMPRKKLDLGISLKSALPVALTLVTGRPPDGSLSVSAWPYQDYHWVCVTRVERDGPVHRRVLIGARPRW